jgi:hypothetical protein
MTLTLTEKLHAQQIRKRLLNGYPPDSALRQERAAHTEKLAWLSKRRAERESPFNRIVKKAMGR